MGVLSSQFRALDIDQFTKLDQRFKKQNELLERIAVALEGGSNGSPEQGSNTHSTFGS